MTKKNFSPKNTKILCLLAQGKCAKCKQPLIKKDGNGGSYHVAEFAHIEGEKEGAKRYNSNMTDEERQAPENIVVLCPTCHTEIDSDEITYTVGVLKALKKAHEDSCLTDLVESIADVDYTCLATILDYIKNCDYNPSNNLNLAIRKIQDKINYNNLSANVKNYITMGLANSELIRNFINQQASLNYGYSEKLKKVFVDKYQELKATITNSDDIFYELWEFATHNSSDNKTSAAALSVVTYFFQECDIFEK